ncbi:hypothetical protein [Helicobacter sp. T3_23-1059]
MNLFRIVVLAGFLVSGLSAYYIGGAYVTLVDCSWGQYGYEYGNIGTYKDSNGNLYRVFFGSNYCQY